MLKLMKYEFRKTRNLLLGIGGCTLLLQLWYMVGFFQKDAEKMMISGVFLMLWCGIFQTILFIMAVNSYSKELNSKSSYLIFMTPNSSYTILFSKMFTTLLQGIVLLAVTILLAVADVNLYSAAVPDAADFVTLLRNMLESAGVPVDEILFTLLSGAASFLVIFFAFVSVAYLSVTLCATFLQNSKAKYVISVALFFLLIYVIEQITNVLPLLYDPPTSPLESLIAVLPATCFHLAVLVLSIFTSGWLLERKVSL